ncbi:DUF6612 family protein [Halobacillus faecis]
MKRRYKGVFIIGGVVTLVALGGTISFGEKLLGSGGDTPVEVQQEMLEGKEVFKQSIQAMTQLQSFHIIGERIKEDGQSQLILEMDVLLGDAPKIHSKSKLPGENGAGQGIEIYLNGDRMYMKTTNEWMMLPGGGGDFGKLKNINADQMDEIWEDREVLEVEESGGNYILSLQDGNPLPDFVSSETMGAPNTEESQSTEIVIEKETYHIKEVVVKRNSEKVSYTISKINAIDKNSFPEKEIENASNFLDEAHFNK